MLRIFLSLVKQKNVFGFLVSCAACIALTGQFVIYVLTNLGIIAPLAVTLPFISFGAMGFVSNMLLLGIVLSVYRRTDLVVDKLLNIKYHRKPLITFQDGKLNIDLGINELKNPD